MRKGYNFSILVLLSMVLAVTAPSIAQGQPSGSPEATLIEIKLIAEGADQSIFLLGFEPRVAGFSRVSRDPTLPALSFARTHRARSANSPQGLKGLERAIEFEQTSIALLVQFNVAAPAKIVTSSSSEKRLLVTVRRLLGSEDADRGSAAPRNEIPE